ncbi:MAG: lipid A deacylase LpxR family protein [Phycisphaerales bacterium]|nr:lipid A deacylase LpxR family protein [Phycisphaerales bacterium]
MRYPRFIPVLMCCLFSSVLIAQDDLDLSADPDSTQLSNLVDSSESWSLKDLRGRDFTVYWENDGTVPKVGNNSDRFYTNGVGFELSLDPQFTDSLKKLLAPPGSWDDPKFGLGIALKQRIYTGETIIDPNPPTTDHPYSGYLYFGFSFQRADKDKHDHFELDLGVVGERSQGEMIQRWIHHTFPDQDEPQGWGHQLANELAINFTYERTWKSRRGEILGAEFEMLPAVGFDLGNVSIKAKGQVTLRGGIHLPDDFGPASFLGHKDHTAHAAAWGKDKFSFYVYATLGVDAVAHNIFLDGNTFASSRSVDSEELVGQATVGVVTRYKKFYAGWSQTYQTENFESQPGGQSWGAIYFGCSFNLPN